MEKEDRFNEVKKQLKFDKTSYLIVIISGLFLLFSFFAPHVFTQKSNVFKPFDGTGEIGDTIGGIMNPFVAIAGILLTFLAFYIQYKANRVQYELFKLEFDDQREQAKSEEIESQFYEMLNFHKQNVVEISLRLTFKKWEGVSLVYHDQVVFGKPAIDLIKQEFDLLYLLIKDAYEDDKSIKQVVSEAYRLFYAGLENQILPDKSIVKPYLEKLLSIRNEYRGKYYQELKKIVFEKSNLVWNKELNFPIWDGRANILGHYFRHLYQTVKFVVSQSEEKVTYERKRHYLRVLRSQLTESEQSLIFYNWYSGIGKNWENKENKFLTDYRMIHNLFDSRLVPGIHLKEIEEFKRDFKKEKNRPFDPLFEYEDLINDQYG